MVQIIFKIVKASALPVLFYSGIAVMVISIFRRPELGLMVLVGLISQPNIYYQLYAFPLGKDFLDLMVISVILGTFFRKGGFTSTVNSALIIGFVVFSYFSLWMTSTNFHLPLPINMENPLIKQWKNYLVMMGFYFLGLNVVKEDDKLQRYIFLIFVLVLLFISIRSFRAFTAGTEFSYETRYEGPFWVVGLGANHLGAFIAQYGILILGMYLMDDDTRRRMLYLAAMIFSLHPLFFSYSRGAYGAALAGVVFYGIIKKRTLLVILAFVYISWHTLLPVSVVDRITMTEEYGGQLEHSAAIRLDLWDHALRIFESSPVVGIGWGGFGYSIQEESLYRDTHNYFLKTLCEQGIVGLGLLLMLLLAAMFSGLQLMIKGKNGFHQGLGLGFMGATVALIVNNFFGDRFSATVVGGYFWLVWGLVDRSIIMNRDRAGEWKEES
jgi:O-antigen ligase